MTESVSKPRKPRSGAEILRDLDDATRGLSAASTELSALTQKHYEATVDENGEVAMGTGLRYEIAIDEEIDRLYMQEKPPPADVREARARLMVMKRKPQLWADYQAEKSRIDALKLWISSAKANINGLQTLRKGEVA